MEKTTLVRSYISGIKDKTNGESYYNILYYFLPELITAFLLSSVLSCVDAYFIAHLKSTSMYATLGVTNTLTHFITKVAEGLSIGAVILCGQYNGIKKFEKVGQAAVSAFWVTLVTGALLSGFLFWGAPWIYVFYQVPPKMAVLGVSYLKIRAVSIFLMFLYFAFIGFLRGIKNTRAPMAFFLLGGAVFVVFDYLFVFGYGSIPAMRLNGSALATVIQYAVMLIAAVCYIFWDKNNRKYGIDLLTGFSLNAALLIFVLSWPVMLDKAVMAFAKMWLAKLIAPLGKTALASFSVIKDMEQFALVPAIAFAQVATLLTSNLYSQKDWRGIKSTTKKIVFLSSFMVFAILVAFMFKSAWVIGIFDKKDAFTDFAKQAFPILSFLAFFDIVQLILAGALRGAANVKTVMITRWVSSLLFFIPVSYLVAHTSFANTITHFIAIYSLFYLNNGIMSVVYIFRFRGSSWKNQTRVD